MASDRMSRDPHKHLRRRLKFGLRSDGGTIADQFIGTCDRCGRDPGQGGVYPLDRLDRSVCLRCLRDIQDEIDEYEVDDGAE